MDATEIKPVEPTATIKPTQVAFEANLRDTEDGQTRTFEDGDPVELE